MDKPCFELKGSLFTLTVLQLFEDDLSLLETQLEERVKMAPDFFNHTPLVIDLHDLPEEKQELDFFALRELLLSLSIIPVGVKGAAKVIHTQLEAAGMAVLAEAKKPRAAAQKQKIEPEIETPPSESDTIEAPEPDTPEPQDKSEPDNSSQDASTETTSDTSAETTADAPADTATETTVNTTRATKVVKQTIRSGRQIYAPGGDLIIIGSVSAGAEILADGNIHVYGALRGRALAGVRGDQSASIFCHSLQSELISIAGIYLLSDDIPADKIGGSVQVFLEDEKLQLAAFN